MHQEKFNLKWRKLKKLLDYLGFALYNFGAAAGRKKACYWMGQ